MSQPSTEQQGRRPRADAQRNRQTVIDAAAAVFVRSGVEAPVRDIAAEAGVGMGTVYRHFPTRADLVVAVFRHQLDALAQQPVPRTGGPSADLRAWVHQLVDFLATKHGLAAALQSDQAGFATLHAEFLNRLIPVCDQLLQAATDAGEIRSTVQTYDLLRAVGNLCIGVDSDRRYHARPMIDLLLDGLSRPTPPGRS